MFDVEHCIDFLIRLICYLIALQVDWPLPIVMSVEHFAMPIHRPEHFFHVHCAALMTPVPRTTNKQQQKRNEISKKKT